MALQSESPPVPLPIRLRRDGRVAEGARLESVYTGNRIVGSNPTLSASLLGPSLRSGFRQRAPAPLRCAQARSRPLSASSSNPTLSARISKKLASGSFASFQPQTLLTAIANASDCAGRESRQSLQSDVPVPRRISRRESAALPHGDGSGGRQGIAKDVSLLPQPWPPPRG